MRVYPNVLLVVLDTARADALEPYGAPRGATPVVADLAARGTAVGDCFAPGNWTLPSHAAMFTGLPPRALGLGQAPGGQAGNCKPYVEAHRDRVLAEVLRRAGYRTRGVSANLWVTSWSGFATGFEQFVEVTSGRNAHIHDRSLRVRAAWAKEALLARVDDGAREVEEVLLRWLDEPRDRPFFWFVNLVECHSPYLPPRPFNPYGPVQRLRAAFDARRHLTMMGVWQASAGVGHLPPPAVERMRRLYAGSVRQLDDWLERVLTAMDRRGVLDDTLVVVTSDHGENLGESGRLGHSFWLDDRLLRVPLVTTGPVTLPTGRVTSLVQLPRLLAEALGLPDHPWGDVVLDGLAIAQSDALTDPHDPRVERARQEFDFDDYAVWRFTTSSTCATDGSLKLVREGEEDWVYDLAADPLEVAPVHLDGRVAAEYGDRLRVLRHAVDATHTDAAAPRFAPRAGEAGHVPPDIEDRMRLLGYL